MPFKKLLQRTNKSPRAVDPATTEAPSPAPVAGGTAHRALGLQKCAEPLNNSQVVDVIFVHGLTGDLEKTWTNESNSCFWPRDLLPSDLPNARIFTYGYDADVAHFFSRASQSRIGNHAQTMLNDLAQTRERTESNDRPLFFVAHSLGGLVVEDTLLASRNSADNHLKLILESTEGIMFMGTPHCGSRLADWAKVITSVAKLATRLNQSILTVLQPESEVLARIQNDYHTMVRARRDSGNHQIEMFCFFEDLDTPGIGQVVPKHSAILPGYRNMSIHSDHAGMTKFFGAQDPGYQRVMGELWLWIRAVNKRSQSKCSELPHPFQDSQPRPLPMEPSYAGNRQTNYFQGSMNNVGQVVQGATFTGTYNFQASQNRG